MRRSLLVFALLVQACDRPAPPASQPAGLLSEKVRPPLGILRLARTSASAADLLKNPKATSGLPSLAFRVDYAGPKTRLEISYEGWHQGQELGGAEGRRTIHVPVSEDAAFGFSDGKSGKEVSVLTVEDSGLSTQEFNIPSIRGRAFRTYEPSWPLEIPDGKDAVIWAVFVDEPGDAPAGASLEERAKRAKTAWLFRIRTADEKK